MPKKRSKDYFSEDAGDYPLSMPLVQLNRTDSLQLQDLFEGVHVFGGLGSGKTMGSGQTLAQAMLRAGFGGLVLTSKPDETELWRRYCEQAGRSDSLLVFGPDHGWSFNFVRYQMGRSGRGAGLAENLVALFSDVLEAHSPSKVLGGDPYWRQARDQLMRNALELVWLAKGEIRFEDVVAVVQSAPLRPSDQSDPAWQESSACYQMMKDAERRLTEDPDDATDGLLDLKQIADYFFQQFAPLDPEPRSSIVSMFGALTDSMQRGVIRRLFLAGTNMIPDLVYSGTVIVIDMPVQEYDQAGKFAQVLLKTVYQRMLQRRTNVDHNTRPVFLWADEAHMFTTSFDTDFQTIARSSRVATVYLSQNLPNYIHALGGDESGRIAAKKLLGAFGIKIFHSNADTETNQYAEELIGKDIQWRHQQGEAYTDSRHTRNPGRATSTTTSHGRQETMESVVQARVFTELARPGEGRPFTRALVFRSGKPWNENGRNVIGVSFRMKVPGVPSC